MSNSDQTRTKLRRKLIPCEGNQNGPLKVIRLVSLAARLFHWLRRIFLGRDGPVNYGQALRSRKLA